METQKKLQYITSEINKIGHFKNPLLKKVKKERIDFYKESISRLEKMDFEKIKNYDFINEVIFHFDKQQKKKFFSKIKSKIDSLEIHKYAPELNKLHFKNGTFSKVPQKTNINDAINYVVNLSSLEQLKTI